MPYQIPAVLVVSERGTLGEFNIGQAMVARVLRPTLETLGVAHHTLADESKLRFTIDSSIKQAFTTQARRLHSLPAAHRRQSGGAREA